MDLNHIITFVRVVETQSFTAAAQALGVPKSSVSRSLSRLEDELGTRLLQRTTRKLSLTDAGTAYYARVQKLISGIDEANAEASERGQDPRGVVRITSPVDIGVSVLADILADFAQEYPKIVVDLVLTSRVVSLVEEGFDMALRAGKLADSSLVARRIATTDLCVYGSKTYLKKHGEPQHPRDLAKHRCILLRGVRGKTTWRLAGKDGEHEVEVTGTVSADDMAFIQRVARAGVGLALLPVFTCDEEPKASGLVRVLPDYSAVGTPIHLVMPSAQYVPARVAALRDFIIARTKTVHWNG
jgi:DNA-binding transcriptional LysR family regulator